VGAGIGASFKIIGISKEWYIGIVFILGIIFFGLMVFFIFEIINFKRKLKELDKWKQ